MQNEIKRLQPTAGGDKPPNTYILRLYDGGGYEYRSPRRGGVTVCSAAGRETLIAEYRGTEARGRYWRIDFEHNFDESTRKLIVAVFPDILQRDASKLQSPKKVYNIVANLLRRADLLKTCPRCGGTGNYSFNHRDGSMCFQCHGFKYIFPKLTDEYIAKVEKHFAEQRATEGGSC